MDPDSGDAGRGRRRDLKEGMFWRRCLALVLWIRGGSNRWPRGGGWSSWGIAQLFELASGEGPSCPARIMVECFISSRGWPFLSWNLRGFCGGDADFRLESLGSWCTCRQQFPPKPKPKPDPTMPPGSGSRRRHARPRSWRHATTRRWTPPPQPVAISTRHHFLALSHHSSCSSVTGQESSPSQVPEAEAEAT